MARIKPANIFLFLSLVFVVADASGTPNHAFSKLVIPNSIDGCSYPASPINFCDSRHMASIKDAIDYKRPDFDRDYIVLPIEEREQYFQRSLVVIDSETGEVYPVPIDFYSGRAVGEDSEKIDGVGSLSFNLKSNNLCIIGAIVAYRSLKNGTFCFHFNGGKFSGVETAYSDLGG